MQQADGARQDCRSAPAGLGAATDQHLSLGLKSKYPDDMTIILQHDFEQLNIREDRFEVLLRLMGARERLSIPFAAIKAFWDKSELKCSDG